MAIRSKTTRCSRHSSFIAAIPAISLPPQRTTKPPATLPLAQFYSRRLWDGMSSVSAKLRPGSALGAGNTDVGDVIRLRRAINDRAKFNGFGPWFWGVSLQQCDPRSLEQIGKASADLGYQAATVGTYQSGDNTGVTTTLDGRNVCKL